MTERLQTQLENLPTEPGIYKYFDDANELIYVGKAINLKNRVKSYFTGNDHSPKTQVLVSHIDHLETITVQSEVDALLLETNLIKEFRPRYNIILKDDKSHLYIKITLYEDLPRVTTCRQTDMHFDTKATYFGPFPSGGTVKQTLRYLRRVFPYVAKHQPPLVGRRRPPQSYFYYNLPLGPVDAIIDKKLYRQQIFQLIRFLEGKRQIVAEELDKEMRAAAKNLEFEQASLIKQQIDGLTYISQMTIKPELYVANPELMAEKRQQGLVDLAEVLAEFGMGARKRLLSDDAQWLHRIECFDISNISGQQAVGSMVVFENGEAKKSDYRKFKIKRENTPNDFAMLQEILRRRLSRLESVEQPDGKVDESFTAVPDLIIVDGGKGQLSAALAVLQELQLTIPVVGMTKREEELLVAQGAGYGAGAAELPNKAFDDGEQVIDARYEETQARSSKPNRSAAHAAVARNEDEQTTQTSIEANFTVIKLARGSEPLFLIQRLRDEAHRFAITYHRKLRQKAFITPSSKAKKSAKHN